MNTKKTSIQIGDKTLEFEIGKYAQQATSAVLARMGDTVVHATIVVSDPRPDIDWFPLQVEYQEKLYAGGKIKGSRWVKREGRPSDDVILKARIIDRSIRPLFPQGYKNEVQVVVTVLSADGENDADIVAMYAVSLGLSLSSIPWGGPLGGVRIGLDPESKEFIANPTYEQRESSDLDLILSASEDAVVMVEAGANEVSETQMLKAFELGHKTIKKSLQDLDNFIKENAQGKTPFVPIKADEELYHQVKKDLGKEKITKMVKAWAKLEPTGQDVATQELVDKYADNSIDTKTISKIIDKLMKEEARRLTVEEGSRPDGRKPDEIRPINCEHKLLPRTHGSAMFQRGSTQALTITTLGSPSLNQLIESMEGEEEKRYIHHYYMPPFTVGETGRMGWPSRREIGHGALAERSLEPMLPSEEEFPYTIHVVSEIMSSNGSTSMASVCGSTMSLLDAGVPLKRPVSGIAMGLIKSGDDYIILSDIQGLEDFTGDMDFKVAGTKEGITGMQMDIKIDGIPMDVLTKALEQAKVGRLHILEKMLAVIDSPQPLSPYAPRIITISVPVDKIGDIIGPGGKMIKSIIQETGAEVDIDDDGQVFISSTDQESMDKAKAMIENIIREVEIGEEFTGEVVRIENYGAFVNLLPGKDGLVHVSSMSTDYVENVHNIVKMGDQVKVRVTDIDPQGKIKLSMLTKEQEDSKSNSGGRHSGSGDRGRRGYRSSRPRRTGYSPELKPYKPNRH